MDKTQTWTAQDFKKASAICQLFGLVVIVLLLLNGRSDLALALFIGFWIGAACASYGARSRTQ